jgi:cellulose synthase/poly-beta-1,6-N-acetylglucosamine synthase-like glycosyltransferase
VREVNRMAYPFVSVIVLTKNNETTIEDCLKSLLNLDYPAESYEIIVGDGHSQDRTAEIAREYGARVLYDKGKCKAGGYNVVIQAVRGEYMAFTDADCIVDRHWLRNLLKYFEQDGVAGAGGPNIAPAHAVPMVKAIEWVSQQSPLAIDFKNAGVSVENIAGCNSIYAVRLIKDLFPLPETRAGEEAILNCRIRRKGLKLVSAPDAIVRHNTHYKSFKAFFKRMLLYGGAEVQVASLYKEMDKPLHKLEGFSVPIALLLIILLYFLSKPALFTAIGLGLVLLLYLWAKCWWQTKSFTIARLVSPVIVTMALGYSLGYVKETLFPERIAGTENKVIVL